MFKRITMLTVFVIAASGILLAAQGRGGRGAGPGGAGAQGGAQKLTAIRAGRLIDPETGSAAANQIILVEGDHITNVGANLPIPQGAEVVDLTGLTVLPGFVD